MKTMAVAEFKAHFSQVLQEVQQGQTIGILYGKARKPVAMLVPYQSMQAGKREIGFLDDKVKIEFMDDFEMTEEELIGMDDEVSS